MLSPQDAKSDHKSCHAWPHDAKSDPRAVKLGPHDAKSDQRAVMMPRVTTEPSCLAHTMPRVTTKLSCLAHKMLGVTQQMPEVFTKLSCLASKVLGVTKKSSLTPHKLSCLALQDAGSDPTDVKYDPPVATRSICGFTGARPPNGNDLVNGTTIPPNYTVANMGMEHTLGDSAGPCHNVDTEVGMEHTLGDSAGQLPSTTAADPVTGMEHTQGDSAGQLNTGSSANSSHAQESQGVCCPNHESQVLDTKGEESDELAHLKFVKPRRVLVDPQEKKNPCVHFVKNKEQVIVSAGNLDEKVLMEGASELKPPERRMRVSTWKGHLSWHGTRPFKGQGRPMYSLLKELMPWPPDH